MRKLNIEEFKMVSQSLYDFVCSKSLKDQPEGKYEFGDGVFLVIKSYKTRERPIGKIESHIKYIDIHSSLINEEKIALFNIENLQISEVKAEDDNIFYKDSSVCKFVEVKVGDFVLLDTKDAHLSGYSLERDAQIKKIVIKIRKDMI